jgi:hypothetical protein
MSESSTSTPIAVKSPPTTSLGGGTGIAAAAAARSNGLGHRRASSMLPGSAPNSSYLFAGGAVSHDGNKSSVRPPAPTPIPPLPPLVAVTTAASASASASTPVQSSLTLAPSTSVAPISSPVPSTPRRPLLSLFGLGGGSSSSSSSSSSSGGHSSQSGHHQSNNSPPQSPLMISQFIAQPPSEAPPPLTPTPSTSHSSSATSLLTLALNAFLPSVSSVSSTPVGTGPSLVSSASGGGIGSNGGGTSSVPSTPRSITRATGRLSDPPFLDIRPPSDEYDHLLNSLTLLHPSHHTYTHTSRVAWASFLMIANL